MKRVFFILAISAVLLIGSIGTVHAVPAYLTLFNSAYQTAATPLNSCGLCHINPAGGGPLNAYGLAFQSGGDNLAALISAQPVDSDGDTFSTIAEINARTFPGNAASTPSAATVPEPVSGQQVVFFAPEALPVLNADPVDAKPFGFGAVATGGNLFDLRIGVETFSAPVDVYLIILAPSLFGPQPVFVTSTLSLATTPTPWRSSTRGPVDEVIFTNLPTALLPVGQYSFALAATPPGSLSTFYLWFSSFSVGRNLVVHLQQMTPHLNQLTELRVVSNLNNNLMANAIVDPLQSANFDLTLPLAVPPGDFRLDFFSDFNNNRVYNAPPADHAWRLNLPTSGTAEVTFVHNTNFTDISAPAIVQAGTFQLSLTGMTPHSGQLFVLRVVEADSGATVGYYRLGAVPASGNFNIVIPGIIDNGDAYRVDFYADFNNNKVCDAPPADHAWRLTGTGGPTGLSLTFLHNTNFTPVCVPGF